MLCLAARTLRRSTPFSLTRRTVSDVVKYQSQGGTVRVPLGSPKVIGIVSTRGTRDHQEDAFQAAALSLPPDELARSVSKHHDINWHPSDLPKDLASQVLFVGIYDGHGGGQASSFLKHNLHTLFETVEPSQVPEVYKWLRGQGGYFRRWRGGELADWANPADNPDGRAPPFDLSARASLAFLTADKQFTEGDPEHSPTCGATASVALLQPLDVPAAPFFSAHKIAVTVAHVGDTRVLLCATDGGRVEPLSETHHAETRGESARLRRMGTSRVMDSFGESRWMGALANTRCIGDSQYKQFGVTPEPTITTRLLEGPHYAYMILVSDGISGILSDDEIVDLARDAADPHVAAQTILSFAEELGTQDNSTVIVVPLAGWGKIHGPDATKELRDYRRRQAMNSEREHRM
ncbi:protein serine/threonine phosphatase 2C [Exidia glandulosa HHB12029]|uniref:Protein serine/threonine phosphatase 2C n=1 Tax=Exidia glandulosa HHB12029 TaxID=1314781 RepID=A0A165PS86_EXIGL|nr:protein serine/threonine phosphatase 2C [Exidia glandulosa HHB12029]